MCDKQDAKFEDPKTSNFEPSPFAHRSHRAACYFFCLARANASAMAIVPVGCGSRSGARC